MDQNQENQQHLLGTNGCFSAHKNRSSIFNSSIMKAHQARIQNDLQIQELCGSQQKQNLASGNICKSNNRLGHFRNTSGYGEFLNQSGGVSGKLDIFGPTFNHHCRLPSHSAKEHMNNLQEVHNASASTNLRNFGSLQIEDF